LGVTGVLTATGGVVGDTTGDLTGDVTGNLTGNVTGAVTGNVTGNVTGDLTGDVTGDLTDLTGNVTGNITGDVTGDLTGNADTATTLATARTITVAGDVTATATSFDGSANITLTTSQANNSVDLGTHTTGSYVENLVAGTGVTLSNNSGEGATPTVAIGQSVGTSDNVTFNNATISGNLTVSGTTTTVNSNDVNIADSTITLNSDETAAPTQDAGIIIERGTASNKSFIWDESEDEWSTVGERLKVGALEATSLQLGGTAVTSTAAELNKVDGFTGTVTDLNYAKSLRATGVTSTEFNRLDGVTSSIQTQLNAKAVKAGSSSQAFSASTLNATTVDLGAWTVTQSGTDLKFAYNGTNRMKLDASGNLTVEGNITAYGSA